MTSIFSFEFYFSVSKLPHNEHKYVTLQVLTKIRMADLVRDIDPNIYMEEEVEEILLGYVDDFVDRVLNGASMIAKHRHVNNIEIRDVQQFLSELHNDMLFDTCGLIFFAFQAEISTSGYPVWVPMSSSRTRGV